MTGLVFVDTNVLLYRHDTDEPEKQRVAHDWFRHLWRSQTGRLSQQVLHEFYTNATRKGLRLDPRYAREVVLDLASWNPIPLDMKLLGQAWKVEARFGFSFWDSLIVAAAQTAKCRVLLTEDLQHGQDLEGVTVVNPFLDSTRGAYASEVHEP